MKYKYDILENTTDGIVCSGVKEVYNLDSIKVDMKEWYSEDIKKLPKIDIQVPLSSAINVASKGYGTFPKVELGVLYNNSNSISEASQGTALLTSIISKPHNTVITKSNFLKAIAGFSARRLIQSNIWNDKDEYMKPSDSILESNSYKQWNHDCIIYSLFDNQSFQSSLRQVDYQSKKWNIINEFFFEDSKLIREYANQHQFIECIDDLDEDDTNRFVYTEIERIKLLDKELTFSQEALDLLNYAKQLIKDSFSHRKLMHEQKEEYHLNSWDIGYAQLKLIWKEYMSSEFKEFDRLRKELANKLRPKVYEFGFLYE